MSHGVSEEADGGFDGHHNNDLSPYPSIYLYIHGLY